MRTVHVQLMLLLVGEHKCCWILFDKILYKYNLVITNIWNRNNHFVGSMNKSLFGLCLHSYVLSSSGKLELDGWGSGEGTSNREDHGMRAAPILWHRCQWKIPVPNTMATGDSVAFRWFKHCELCSVACIYCVCIYIYTCTRTHITFVNI